MEDWFAEFNTAMHDWEEITVSDRRETVTAQRPSQDGDGDLIPAGRR